MQKCTANELYLYRVLHNCISFFIPVKSKKSIHRGEVLQNAISKSGVSVTLAAKRAGYSRSSYYNHILDPQLDFSILKDYGKAIRHDFSVDIPEMQTMHMEEDNETYVKPATLEQAIKEAERWRQKYYNLLEKYHHLIEEKIKR